MQLNTHDLNVQDGSSDEAPIVFLHGNGLHARTLGPLAERFGGRRCVGIDLRGFGLSRSDVTDTFDWSTHVDDLHETLAAEGLVGADLVGHSMGGAIALMLEVKHPGSFRQMAVYEPIVFPPPADENDMPNFEGVLRRRAQFESVEIATERFASKPPWADVVPAALTAFVEWGLRPADDGDGVVLRCDPRHEYNNFRAAHLHDTWKYLHQVAPRVLVLRGVDGPAADAADGVAGRLPNAELLRFDDLHHFGPMQNPAAVAGVIQRSWASPE